MKKRILLLQILICSFCLLSCKKEEEINIIDKISGNYEITSGSDYEYTSSFTYEFTTDPSVRYRFMHPTTKISANKGSTPTEIVLAMPYWGTGLVVAEQTLTSTFELKSGTTALKLTTDGVNFVPYTLKLTGKVSFVDNTIFVNIVGKDEEKNLLVKYNYIGTKIL